MCYTILEKWSFFNLCDMMTYMNSTKIQQEKKLEHLVEQKILEFFGDPDAGLELKKGFASMLKKRMQKPQKLTSNVEVAKRYGLR